MNSILFIIIAAAGIILLIAGIALNIYASKSILFRRNRNTLFKWLVSSKAFISISDFITGNSSNAIYRVCNKLLKKAEADMSVQTLIFYKLITIVFTAVILLMVRYTNIDATKVYIISNTENNINLFGSSKAVDYKYNFSLYKAVLVRIGEKNLAKLNEDKKVEAVSSVLSNQMTGSSEAVQERAEVIVRTFNRVESLKLLDWKTVLMILLSFFIPDIVLLLRRMILNSKYKREVVNLENIFELLGSIKGFKTIYILKEMSKASKSCSKQINACISSFQSDREQALEDLRKAIPNRRFSRLVDIIRVYSLVDKNLAMEILERNRLEKEEEMLLTAEEDIDIVDVVAFLSVTPIIFELGNLMMKPMMDIIFQAFTVI